MAQLAQGNIFQNWQNVIDESAELQNRYVNMDRDFKDILKITADRQGFLHQAQAASTHTKLIRARPPSAKSLTLLVIVSPR